MQVTVAFTTQLKAALGKSQQAISLPDVATVHDAIVETAKLYPDEFSQYVFNGERLLPSILLSQNDRQVNVDAKLSDGDVVTLLSAISGG